MKIALIYDPESKYGTVWLKWLTEDGHKVVVFKDETTLKDIEASIFDIAIPLITIRDYVNQPNPRMNALRRLEADGTTLLTNSTSIASSSDKLLTYQIWNKNGIKQPTTFLYDEVEYVWPESDGPVLIKPRFGHSGNNIFLVKTLNELNTAVKQIEGDALIQEYIERPKCVRVIATDEKVLCAYEKVLEGHVVVSVEKGAIRKYFEPSEKLMRFTTLAIKALGGGLMGLDVLKRGGQYIALEANVPFGFDENNVELKTKLLHLINGYLSKRPLN